MIKVKKTDGMTPAQIEQVPVERLQPHPRNARTHSKQQIAKIATSIEAFGWLNPILIDADNTILAGHGRLAAAKQLKRKTVPAIRVEHLSEADKRAYLIADNRLTEIGEWDIEKLAGELSELKSLDLAFDLDVTGFDLDRVSIAAEAMTEAPATPRPAAINPERKKALKPTNKRRRNRSTKRMRPGTHPVSRLRDRWRLRDHRLCCWMADLANDIHVLMQGEEAQMAYTALPIGVRFTPGKDLGLEKHLSFAGFDCPHGLDDVLRYLLPGLNAQDVVRPGGVRFLRLPTTALTEVAEACRYICTIHAIWDLGGELVLVGRFPCTPGAPVDDILIQAVSDAGADGVRVAVDAILAASQPGDSVLDVFAGSGDVLMAAEITDRRFRGFGLPPHGVDVAIRRWEEMTGEAARLEHTGQTFAEVAKARAREPANRAEGKAARHVKEPVDA